MYDFANRLCCIVEILLKISAFTNIEAELYKPHCIIVVGGVVEACC